MVENPRGLFVWGEMSEKLKELSDTRYGNAKVWLTDRYDETRAPEDRSIEELDAVTRMATAWTRRKSTFRRPRALTSSLPAR
jgi:hypothetical protein